jgi:hypothetical protein
MERLLLIRLAIIGLLLLPLKMSGIGPAMLQSVGIAVATSTPDPYSQFSADNQYWGEGDSWWRDHDCYSRPGQFECRPKPPSNYCNADGSWDYDGKICYPGHEHERYCYNKSGKYQQWWC